MQFVYENEFLNLSNKNNQKHKIHQILENYRIIFINADSNS